MPFVLLQLLLGQREDLFANQGGNSNLDPVRTRSFVIGAITAGQPVNFFCRQRRSGIEVAFTREEWQALRGLFGEALALPEVQPVLEELSLVYGEI